MPPYRLALLACLVLPVSLAAPVAAQTYEGSSTEQPSVRRDRDNAGATARTQRRLRAERSKRRDSVRNTDPDATFGEQRYRNGRLSSEAGTYSLPAPSGENRSVLVPQY